LGSACGSAANDFRHHAPLNEIELASRNANPTFADKDDQHEVGHSLLGKQSVMKPPFVSVVVLSFLALALAAGCRFKVGESNPVEQSAHTAEEQTAALQSVRVFLRELDRDEGDTWAHVSATLKASTINTAWSASLAGLKTMFGKNVERGAATFAFTEKMPDAPSGRYFICDISSKFERGDVTERVVLVQEADQWKIAGYFRTKTVSFQRESKKS
jgi:hypothetical protein